MNNKQRYIVCILRKCCLPKLFKTQRKASITLLRKIAKFTLNHKPWKESSKNIQPMCNINFDSSLQIKRYTNRMIFFCMIFDWLYMSLRRVSFLGCLIYSDQRLEIKDLILNNSNQTALELNSSWKRSTELQHSKSGPF